MEDMMKPNYIVFDLFEYEVIYKETEEEAIKEVENILDHYRDYASSDGWPEDFEDQVGYAKVVASNKQIDVQTREMWIEDYPDEDPEDSPFPSSFDEMCDYVLKRVD